MDLNSLVEAATGASDTEARTQAVRAALAAGETPNLADLEQAAASRFAELAEPGETGYSDEQIEQMGVVADVVDAIRAEAEERAASAARVAELTERVGKPTVTAPPEQPKNDAPEAPAEPAATPESPAEPETPAEPAEPAAQPGTEATNTPAEPEKELVVASGQKKAVARVQPQVPLATLPKQVPAQRGGGTTNPFTITAAADVPGVNLGAELDIEGLTNAVMSRFQQLSRGGGDFGGGSRSGIASINIERDSQFVAETQHDWQVIERACDETRLPGGSLLAAAEPTPGWCAPCEVSYEFCPIAVVDGLIDLPSVTARRGCITWPQSPEFHTIYSGTGFCVSPEQVDNMQLPVHPTWDGTPPEPADGPWYNPTVGPAEKPCYKIPCPPNEDMILEPCGLCIQASILHERAYPELIRYTVQQALVAHAHKMNCKIISDMAAQAVTVDLTANANLGPGATATVLESIEMQVEWLRYRHRLGIDTTMEMVAPVWMRGILRADLSKRMGVDMLNVTNQTLNAYLVSRGVRVQWVLDWQDAFCDPASASIPGSTLFGGGDLAADPPTPQTAWPLTGQVLIYPAGTYFLARMDVINLEGGLLDSTLLRKNERIVLFTEEALAVGKRCYESLLLNLPLCASGQTGSGARVDCGLPAPYQETAPA